MKDQDKQPGKTPETPATLKPQQPAKSQGRKPDELSIDELAKVSGGARRRNFGRE